MQWPRSATFSGHFRSRVSTTQSVVEHRKHGYSSWRPQKCQKGCPVHPHGRRYVCNICTVSFASKRNPSIGASGTGRTTFVNTLCESEVLAHKISDNPETAHIEEGIKIKPINVGQCADSVFAKLGWRLRLHCRARRRRCSNCSHYRRHSWFRRQHRQRLCVRVHGTSHPTHS